MIESDPDNARPRWPRGQRFQLSAVGREAGASYRAAIVASRSESGRASFDAARAEWAARFKLDPADGLYLGELVAAPLTVDEIAAALEGCGTQRTELKAAVDRLVGLHMLEPVIKPAPPPQPPRRW